MRFLLSAFCPLFCVAAIAAADAPLPNLLPPGVSPERLAAKNKALADRGLALVEPPAPSSAWSTNGVIYAATNVVADGLFWVSAHKPANTNLVLRRSSVSNPQPNGPWPVVIAAVGCNAENEDYVFVTNGTFDRLFVHGSNEPCDSPNFAPAGALGARHELKTPWGEFSVADVVGIQLGDGVKAYKVIPALPAAPAPPKP